MYKKYIWSYTLEHKMICTIPAKVLKKQEKD